MCIVLINKARYFPFRNRNSLCQRLLSGPLITSKYKLKSLFPNSSLWLLNQNCGFLYSTQYFLVSHHFFFFIVWLNDLQFSGEFRFSWLQVFNKKMSELFISYFIVVLNKTTTRPSRPKPSGTPRENGMGTGDNHKFISFWYHQNYKCFHSIFIILLKWHVNNFFTSFGNS